MQLQRLMQSLKQIEEQQKELQAAIQTAKAERESMLKKDRDFYEPAAKELPPPRMEVRMLCIPADLAESLFPACTIILKPSAPPEMLGLQELRDYNLLDFGEDDMLRRKEDAHKARPKFIPSGGLAGFRVASDLAKMDFTAAEESE